jgi:hypothetical protein
VREVTARHGRLWRSWDAAVKQPAVVAFSVALGLRVALATIITVRFGGLLFGDDGTYPQLAVQVAEGALTDEYSLQLYGSTATYTYPLTWMAEAGMPMPFAGQVWTAMLGAVTAGFVAHVIHWLTRSPSIGLAMGLIIAVFPAQVLFSSITLKDAAVWAVASGAAAGLTAIDFSSRRSVALGAGLLVMLLTLMGFLREHTMVVMLFALLGATALSARRGQLFARGVLLVVLVLQPVSLGHGLGAVDFIRANGGSQENRRIDNAVGASTAVEELAALAEAERLASEQSVAPVAADADGQEAGATASDSSGPAEDSAAASGDTSASAEGDASVIGSAPPGGDVGEVNRDLAYLPRGLQLMILDPLPMQLDGNRRVLFAFVENMLLWYPLLVLALLGLPIAFRRRHPATLYAMLFGGGILLLYALTEGNFGTAYRHRGEVVWAAAVAAGFGVEAVRGRLERRHVDTTSTRVGRRDGPEGVAEHGGVSTVDEMTVP